jgi:hypothetical protein
MRASQGVPFTSMVRALHPLRNGRKGHPSNSAERGVCGLGWAELGGKTKLDTRLIKAADPEF